MSIQQKIIDLIQSQLQPDYFDCINVSHQHQGHSGDNGSGDTHFQLIVVSDQFEGRTRILRHKAVMDVISCLFEEGLHAASIKVYTNNEYKQRQS